ncbi:ATP-dependent Clp protease ATP-binding subunit [Clostridiaceae bacterium HSG29]|nr:ATP-dependent Clp protease ATP-binding subunit [Clostridiaceae bacterium HSG29]
MIMCSDCHEKIAVVFVNKIEDGKNDVKGYCIECAEKRGIDVESEIKSKTGMSSEEFQTMNKQMQDMFKDMDMDSFKEQMETMMPGMLDAESDNGEGGNSFMNAFNALFKGSDNAKTENTNKEKSDKKFFNKKTKNLDKFGTNLTEAAKNGKVDRVVGRNKEIDRVIQILNRRSKNNPVLIGEPGVGKTAIAEGLAVRIVNKEVPEKIYDAQIYLLDLTAVVAGTQFRGQFEGRLKKIIDEVVENGNIILVIDEVHSLVGTGDVQGGSMNAANILKPALAKGQIQIIGSTTLEDYRKNIEKDAALERRFQKVLVDEPTMAETVEIIEGIKDYYQDFHKVNISKEVIEKAVYFSERYITDRFLPDKAIDVIDEAGSRANLKNKGLVEIKVLEDKLKNIEKQREKLSSEEDYQKSAELKMKSYSIIKEIESLQNEMEHVELTFDDIAYVIEAWTNIPVNRVNEEEAERLLKLEERLKKRVIGQDAAVISLAKTVRRNRSGFKRKRKPASFIFVGPTGVGKTELARVLAEELFGSEEAMIRIDMSEYMEKHTVSKLIGAPPGYIGHDQGGQLTEKIRRKPYSVILLDEIEKAHHDVFNMLLQILEDGRLTDSQGRTVFFDNSIIIMTSNAGTDHKSAVGFENKSDTSLKQSTDSALRKIFRPEFLNRVDETIIFNRLKKDELKEIIKLMIEEVNEEMKDKNMKLVVSDLVIEYILEKGYSVKYGARPLRRVIQKYIEDEIAEKYLRDIYSENDTVYVELKNDKLIFS